MTMLSAPKTTSRRRRIAFYSVSGVFLAALVSLLGPGFGFFALVWLPDATLESLFGEVIAPHKIHGVGFPTVAWVAAIGTFVQFRRPDRKAAPLWQAFITAGALTLAEIAGGMFDPLSLVFVAFVVAMVVLHPVGFRVRSFRIGDRRLAGLAAVATVPLAIFAYGQIQNQRLGLFVGPHSNHHVEEGHFASMAGLAIVIALVAFLAATDLSGWRISAWSAGAAAALYGLASVVYPELASSAGVGWGLAAVIWGVAFVAAAERRAVTATPAQAARPLGEYVDGK